MKKKPTIPMIGFLQASGIAAYVFLVGTFMQNLEKIFGNKEPQSGFLLVILLFVFSALITALMALGYPILLFWEKKKTKEALTLVVFTAGWLAAYFLFFLVLFLI